MALYFISGKGGVGKTHLSTSLAFYKSSQGRKVLLVEFSGTNHYSSFFEKNIGFVPTEAEPNFFLATWNGLDCLNEYAAKILRSERLAALFFQNKVLKDLISLAPGLKEIALLGKATSDYRKQGEKFKTGFDDIIVDAPSSGHFLSILKSPKAFMELVKRGPMRRQSESIQTCLSENSEVHFALIDIESKLVYTETKETLNQAQKILFFNSSKKIEVFTNYKSPFPYIKKDSWLTSSKDLAKYWRQTQWA